MTVSRRLAVAAAVLSLTIGCGGGNSPDPNTPSPGNPPAGETISGGERLGWNQSASSPSALRTYQFTLYVDGARINPNLSDTRCSETAGTAGYDCSGRLPAMPAGTHGLQLTATAGGIESARSATLTVTVVPRLTSASTSASRSGAVTSSNDPVSLPDVCFESVPEACYRTEIVARGLGPVTGFASLADGTAIVIESGRRLRLLTSGALREEPALVVPQDVVISSVAGDPDFARTHHVFVAETRALPRGELALDIVRYRMLEGALGEAATIVDHLPVAATNAQLAVDRQRDILIAMPAAETASRPAGPYDGRVLRFDDSGATVPGSRGASPVFSIGYARPSALVEAPDGAWWLTGSGGSLPAAIARVEARQAEWPRLPRAVAGRTGSSIASLTMVEDPGAAATAILYVSQPEGTVYRAWLARTARTTTAAAPLSATLAAAVVGSDGTGVIYLALRPKDEGGRGDIVRLVPRQ